MRAIIALFAILMFLTSCSSYINSLHRQISREERAQSAQSRAPQRRGYINDRKPINNPVTLNGAPNQLTPKLERDLERMRKRRMKSSDLVDNSQAPSLWNGSSDESYLFIKQNVRRPGDIVIIDVHSNMKNQIQEELKRAFPLVQNGKLAKGSEPEASEEAPVAEATDGEGKKVYDKISTQVIEEVNKDYLLLRGRKEVMFRKRKRFIEIQTLVPKKAISEANTVNSDRVIEPKIYALRYSR
jgi:flagellar L-ring protein precursor FlgH